MCNQRLATHICAQRAILSNEPDNAVAWQSLGISLRRVGAYEEALEALETASLLAPLAVIARFALADCFVYAEKPDLARSLYAHISLEDDRAAANVRLAAARSLAFLGDVETAASTAKSVLQERPNYAAAYFDLSCYRAKQGASVLEVEHLTRRAIHFAPGEVRYRVSLSLLLYRNERTDEAIEMARSLSIESIAKLKCASCLSRLADLFEAARDFRRSAAAREMAQRVNSNGDGNC